MHRGTLDPDAGSREPAPAGEPDGLGLHAARPSQLPARDELLRPAGKRAGLLPAGPSPSDGPQPPALQPERPDAGGLRPGWDGERLDWTAWDRRFGPLLDGSAFADLPRKGVPIECFYLPLHENWPSPMEGNYNGGYWADRPSRSRIAGPSSRPPARSPSTSATRGWNETLFHGFLNNKNNFKARGWSRGRLPGCSTSRPTSRTSGPCATSPGPSTRGSTRPDRRRNGGRSADGRGFPRMVFRADISRPQWRRDALDGLLDYHVVGSAMRQYPRLVFDRKRRLGEIVVEYGGTNPVRRSNLQPVGWSLDAWSLGADGVLPWQTVGTAESWRQGRRAGALLPAAGRDPAEGRARRGPLGPAQGLSPRPAGRRVPDALGPPPRPAAVGRRPAGPRGPPPRRFPPGDRDRRRRGRRPDRLRGLRPQDLWALRVRIGEALSRSIPPR